MATRHHGWCLTANNPADDYIVALEARLSPGDYAIVGREVAPTTGTVHYQGYIHYPGHRFEKSMFGFYKNLAKKEVSYYYLTSVQNYFLYYG